MTPKEFRFRVLRAALEFPQAITLVCELVMCYIGCETLIGALFNRLSPAAVARWGVAGVTLWGLAFAVIGAHGALYREKESGLTSTLMMVVLIVMAGVHPFNFGTILFAVAVFAGGLADSYRRHLVHSLDLPDWYVSMIGDEHDPTNDDT